MNITKTFKRALAGAAVACALVVVATPAPALASTSKAVPVYRVYNPNSGEHVFMTSQDETNKTVKAGWRLEGIAWYAPTQNVPGANPLYRVYNPNANGGDHHYTTDWKEYRGLVNAGWNDEGTAFYVNGNISTVSVYRAYNPTPNVAGSHHFTTAWNEVIDVVNHGWRNESTDKPAFKVINALDVNESIKSDAKAFVARYPKGHYPSGLGDGGAKVLPAPNKGNNGGSTTTNKQTTTTKPQQQMKYVYVNHTVNEGSSVNVKDLLTANGVRDAVKYLYYDGAYANCWSIDKQTIKAVKYNDGGCDVTVTYQTDTASVTVYLSMRDTATNASGQTITVQNAPNYVTTLHGNRVELTEQGKRQWVAHKGRTIIGFDFDGSKGYGLDFKSFSENVYGKVTNFNDPVTHVPYQYNRGSAWGACSVEGVSTSFNYQSMIFEHASVIDDTSTNARPTLGRMTIPNYGIFDTHSKAADQAFALYLEEQAVANQSSYWDITESYGISQLQYRSTDNVVTSERRVDYTITDDCGGDYYEYIRRMLLPYNDHMSPTWVLCQRWHEVAGDANSSDTAIKRQNRYWCVWQDQLR